MCDRWCLAKDPWRASFWSTRPASGPMRASANGSSEASTSLTASAAKKQPRRIPHVLRDACTSIGRIRHFWAKTSANDQKKTGRHVAGPLCESWLLLVLHLEKAERCSLGVGEDRESPTREVRRLEQRLCAKLGRLLALLVDVRHCEVREPVARHLSRDHWVHLHAAGDAFAVDLEFRVLALALAHGALLRAPSEQLLVEGLRLLEAACIQLGPAISVGLADDQRACHLVRLPYADGASGRVLDDGHRALRADSHRLHHHAAAGGLGLLGGVRCIGGRDVYEPRGRGLRRHFAADPRHILACDPCHPIAAVLRVGIDLDIPPEQLRVELTRTRRI